MNLIEFAKLKFFEKKDEFKASLNQETLNKLEEFQAILKEINNDIAQCYALKPVNKELMIAGGAIRDTVLDKNHLVKDLDVFLSLDFIEEFDDRPNPLSRSDFYQRLIDSKVIDENQNNKESDSNLILKALVHQLKNKYEIEAIINTENDMPIKEDHITNSAFENDYRTNEINGVIKLKHPKMAYPIDLIVTFASSYQVLKDIFDFNLCKIALKHSYLDTKAINNIHYEPSFLTDIQDKTITLAIAKQSYNKMSIQKHLPSLLKKYPDYRVICPDLNEENTVLLEKVVFDNKFNVETEMISKTKDKKKNKV
jgi:hypothetical protein